MVLIPQFGKPHGTYRDRPGAYAVIYDDKGQMLTVLVRGICHLPGGGIDQNEDPALAVTREVKEETGYKIASLKKIGEANQFFETTALGPINKLGTYFSGHVEMEPPTKTQESDHEVRWMSPEEFLSSSADDFHKWAVKKSLE